MSTYSSAMDILNRRTGDRVPDAAFDRFGHHWESLYALYPSLFFMVMFVCLKTACKAFVFPPVARLFGVKGKAVTKFSYQGWLLVFYISSTIYGYLTLRDKPWVSYPLGESQKAAMDEQWRTVAPPDIALYYSYQIGFFLAELYAIFTEPKRSDFLEYLLHHVVTLYLIIFSWMGYEYRIGSYVLIIHDVGDIFLCLAKMARYCKARDAIVNPLFGLFVVSFAFFRLYCLPVLSLHLLTSTRHLHSAFASYLLGFALSVILQGLHVFWFFLIMRVIFRMLVSGDSADDVRSDDEEEEDSKAMSGSSETRKKAAIANSSSGLKGRKAREQPTTTSTSSASLSPPTIGIADGEECHLLTELSPSACAKRSVVVPSAAVSIS